MDCPQHPIRKRRNCETCQAPYPTGREPAKASPRTTEDGLTWLDPDGNAPKLDAKGLLVEPFVLQLGNGARERWMPGAKLPMSPGAYRAWVAEIEAKRAKAPAHKGRS
jgi:hypothetical protein